jgi:AcrR family transcriptional regulator
MATRNSPAPRPRNSQATKELLLTAATEEFAEYGLAGARIDRIAERSGANKRLIYMYFGDKDQLFDAVTARQSELVMGAVRLDDGDLSAFAAARFDYLISNPYVSRLTTWRTLERAEPNDAELEGFQERIESVAAAQKAGRLRSDILAVDLFAIVLRMSDSWISAPPALKAATGPDPMSSGRLNEHRAALLSAVESVTAQR